MGSLDRFRLNEHSARLSQETVSVACSPVTYTFILCIPSPTAMSKVETISGDFSMAETSIDDSMSTNI